ncbi:MAG: FMN-binding protein [Eubacteriales bacterium]|nr:FMN-binding protein [Eubacteriales bacterium]
MKINIRYLVLSVIIAVSLGLTALVAYQIADPSAHELNADSERQAPDRIVKEDTKKTAKKAKKNKKNANKFKKNKDVDKIVHKPAKGKNPSEVGDKLNNSNQSDLNLNALMDGVYHGSATGYEGLITVRVTVKDGKIVDIAVEKHNETSGYAEKGFGVIARILAAQSPNVDAVSGATVTSNAIMVAVYNALQQAQNPNAPGTPDGGPNGGSALTPPPPVTVPDKERSVPFYESVFRAESFLEKLNIDMSTVPDGTYYGEAEGFNEGRNRVRVVVRNRKVVEIVLERVVDDDVAPYFTGDKRKRLIKALSNDINVDDVKSIDGVSGATYSAKSIQRAVKKALRKYELKGVKAEELAAGVRYITDGETKQQYLEIDGRHGLLTATFDGFPAYTVSTKERQFISANELNKNTKIVLKDVNNKIIYEGTIGMRPATVLPQSETDQYRRRVANVLPKVTKNEFELQFLGENNPTGVTAATVPEGDHPLPDDKVLRAIKVDGLTENQSYFIGDTKFKPEVGKNYKVFVKRDETATPKPVNNFVRDNTLYIVGEGNGIFLIAEEGRDKLAEQIQLWIDKKVADEHRTFVQQSLPDLKLKDNTYTGFGYGYKTAYTGNRWQSEVVVKDGKIASIKIKNQPDDGEYVVKAEPFKKKINDGEITDVRQLLTLAVELEKYYDVESEVADKDKYKGQSGHLPILDNEKNTLVIARKKLRAIDPDTVSGATMSTTGIVRSIVDAIKAAADAAEASQPAVPEYISVATVPKNTYTKGDSLDLSALVLRVEYSDKSTENVPYADFVAKGITTNLHSGDLLEKVGTVELVISLNGLKAKTGIRVNDIVKEPMALSFIKKPKANYKVGEKLDLGEMVVSISYTNGESIEVAYSDFVANNLSTSIPNDYVFNDKGTFPFEVRLGQLTPLSMNIEVIAENASTLVEDTVQDFDSNNFVRPPEPDAVLHDGVYIGHGRGYYPDNESYLSPYVRFTKVQVTVSGGKVTDVRLLNFGDDYGGGGIGYYGKAERFRGKVFTQVKTDMTGFVKQHLDIERYMAAIHDHKAFPGDTYDDIAQNLRPALKDLDAIGGATFSKASYSRAIAEAIYKAASNEVMINDMVMEDFELDYKLQHDEGFIATFNASKYEDKRNYRTERNYHQVFFYNGEKYDPTNLLLTVSYTDGTEKQFTFDELEENGFEAWYYDADMNKSPLTRDLQFSRSFYVQYLTIVPKNFNSVIKSYRVDNKLYSLSDPPANP